MSSTRVARTRYVAMAFIFAGAVALAGCGGSSGSSGRAVTPAPATARMQHVTIDTTDEFRFVPADPTVHAGPVELTLTDSGSYPHNISFGSLHRTSKTVTGSLGQQRTTLTLDLKPGTYDFVCTYHSSAGMKGRLVVK